MAGLLLGKDGKPEDPPFRLGCSSLACWTNSSGDKCDPWQAQTIRIWVPLYLYVTPDIVLPLGPGPVVETHGRFGDDPLPPNFSSAAIPGLMAGYSGGTPSVFGGVNSIYVGTYSSLHLLYAQMTFFFLIYTISFFPLK